MAYNPFQPSRVQTTVPGIAAPTPSQPWLLYVYPASSYPRRVIIYMREKNISESMIKLVHVRPTFQGDTPVDPKYAPRPEGSLPILVIPSESQENAALIYIRQANAIMQFLEEICNDFQYGFGMPRGTMLGGEDPLARARAREIWTLADEIMVTFTPICIFGSGVAQNPNPEAAQEMLRWLRRSLAAVERFFEDRDMSLLRDDRNSDHISMADIALYSSIEFVDDWFGFNMTIGSGESGQDVYGHETKDEYPKLVEFYQTFKTRASVKRDVANGEGVPEDLVKMMSAWKDGVL